VTTPDSMTRREVREILRTFNDSTWTAMTLEVNGMRITVGKNGPPAQAAAPRTPEAPAKTVAPVVNDAPPVAVEPARPVATPAAQVDTAGCVEVRSPTVGAFWTAPSPGEPPFVQVGQKVEAGQQLAIVEVMKLMNPVLAAQAGEVVQVCAENAALVEFEQPLFLIRPSDG